MANSGKEHLEGFAKVVEVLGQELGVTYGQPGAKKTFGYSALKVNDKIFAIVSSVGQFVVKLPRARVDELEAAGAGKRSEASCGRPMKEWLQVDTKSDQEWGQLAREALSFVRSLP